MEHGRGRVLHHRVASWRRTARTLVVVVAVSVMAVLGPWLSTAHAPPGSPDVVIFLTDDQRSDSLGAMPYLRSEVLGRGVSFPEAMVPTSLCCPSRATILTGRFAHDTGVWGNHMPWGSWRRFHELGNEDDTLAVALDEFGYETVLLGKYMNGYKSTTTDEYPPPGWDRFESFEVPGHTGAYYGFQLRGSPRRYGPREYSTDVLAQRADQIIRRTPGDTPLFLYIAPFAPHGKFIPPRRYAALEPVVPTASDRLVEDRVGKPPWVRRQAPVPPATAAEMRDGQHRTLRAVDDAVERVIGSLRKSGRLRNTLFIFLSDNGLMRGEHELVGKNLPYRATTSIPMGLRWDARVPAGTVDERIALNVDVAATVAAATGAPMDTGGLDLLGDRTRRGFPVEAIGRQPPGRPSYCGWRTKRYLFVHYSGGVEELYDYRTDPDELANRVGDPAYRQVVDDLRARAREGCDPTPPRFTWR